MPIDLRYGIGLGPWLSGYAFAGPPFAFNMADDIQSIDWKWKNTYMSFNIGAGVSLMSHLAFNLNYNFGCGKSGETGAGDVVRRALRAPRASAWQLGMTYYFSKSAPARQPHNPLLLPGFASGRPRRRLRQMI